MKRHNCLLLAFLLVLILLGENSFAQYSNHRVEWKELPSTVLKKHWCNDFSKAEMDSIRQEDVVAFYVYFDYQFNIVKVEHTLLGLEAIPEVVYSRISPALITRIEEFFKEYLKIKDISTLGEIDKHDPYNNFVTFILNKS
jgi:hypothetical protein